MGHLKKTLVVSISRKRQYSRKSDIWKMKLHHKNNDDNDNNDNNDNDNKHIKSYKNIQDHMKTT